MEEQLFSKVWTPTLVHFTRWVLNRARSKNISKLYFLARDAYYPYLIAEKLTELEHMNIECRYLEGSRYAWRRAESALPETDFVEMICIGGVHVTLQSMLNRTGLPSEDISRIAEELTARRYSSKRADEELNRELTYQEVVDWKPYFRESRLLAELVRKHSQEQYSPAIEYFRQEGLFDEGKNTCIGIVDSGWTGTLQQTLIHLLKSAGQWHGTVQGFYFGLYELPRGAEKETYESYFFGPYGQIERKVKFSNCLFETVCTSPNGMTLGYSAAGGRVVPYYEETSNLNRQIILRQTEILKQFLKGLTAESLQTFLADHREEECRKDLMKVMSLPTSEEALLYGNYRFTDDVLTHEGQTLSKVLTEQQMKGYRPLSRLLIMKGWLKGELQETAWPEGSVVLSGQRTRQNLFHVRWYKRLVYFRKWLKGIR